MTDPLLLASLIALSTTVVFALSNHVQHVALDHMDVRAGTVVNVATTAALLWLAAPFFLEPESLLTTAVGLFALAGLIVPSLSMTLHTWSVQLIGPGLTAGLTSTSPVFALMIAVAVLAEAVTGQILVGTAIVVGGVGFIALSSIGGAKSWPLWALAIPLGAALTRAFSHNVIKIGLGELPSPMTAALVGATVSLLVLLTFHVASGKAMPRIGRGYLWFGLCGVMNGIGLVGLNLALHFGEVIVVAPLISTTPVLTLLIGWLFFRRERIRWSTIGAIALIFSGCLLIVWR